MADNVELNAGSGGANVATDQLAGGEHVQYVKLMDGTLDGSGKVAGDAANGLDVDVTRLPSLPAGSNAIGKLAANSGVDIGDVDVTSMPATAADGAAGLPASTVVVAGYDGTNVQALVTDSTGRPTVNVNGTVPVSGALTDAQLRATAVPVSGTVTANLGTAAVTNAGTFAVQIAANSSVNQAQVAGTTTDTNSGNKSAGTQRVVLATDQPQLTNALKVDGSAVTQPVSGTVGITVNSAVNQAQIAGTATSVNSGSKDAGTQRVILASDQTVIPVSDNSGSLTVDAPVGTPVFTTVTPSVTGGWSKTKYAAQTTTVQTAKGTAGTFGGYYVYNPNASVAYVQVFDAATATTVTLGTTVPDMIFGIPASSAANLEITNGVNMANGIKLACTTTATGSTAPGTGLDLTAFFK